ncbi:hypothetical protein ElyMa_001598600 [Elysia marginata]|uniref:Uncharacterized protein n=1 Tax=Elysia marginata TaxID=1093978 RepID=A0AAV4JFT9_9GAST|nr:hypothetical protein ElyMa_001598600 [Elysia marginata]
MANKLYQMDRQGQTTFLLRTDHSRLKALCTKYTKLAVTSARVEKLLKPQSTLQDCQKYRKNTKSRQAIWSSSTDLQTKHWKTLEGLEETNSFLHHTGVNI